MFNNTLRDKVRSVSNDNSINSSNYTVVGRVIRCDEMSNICDIDLAQPSTGIIGTVNNVPVSINSTGVIGWFPSIGDFVMVRINSQGNSYEVVSPCNNDYDKNHRHDNDTKYNTVTNFYNYTIGGNIF